MALLLTGHATITGHSLGRLVGLISGGQLATNDVVTAFRWPDEAKSASSLARLTLSASWTVFATTGRPLSAATTARACGSASRLSAGRAIRSRSL
jgi:hypothetical protein